MADVRGLSIALGLALLGCNYDATSQGGGSGTSGSSSSGELGESTRGGEGSSTTVVAEGSGTASSGGSGSTGGSSSGSGDSTTGAPLPTARSCAEILEEDPKAQTGVHPIVSTSDETVFVEVWCDMEVDEGGWTLVARSENTGNGPFGWGVARGEMEDVTQPYSLDVMSLGMPFREVLVGERSGWAAVVENAYVIEVPEGFLEDYDDSTYMTDPARTVVGDCEPDGGPEILERIGHTASEQSYFFRDIMGFDVHGLQADELETYFDDCENGGNLDDEQGVLFVR